jgi:uncharacterized membrane protein YqjE
MEIPTQSGHENNESIIHLIRSILQDTLALSAKEITAAKLEIKQEVAKALKSGISLVAGGLILAIGFVLLSLMFVFILTSYTSLPLWASLGIIGVVYFILGGVVIWAGAQKAGQVKALPTESLQSTKQDVRYIAEQATRH